MTDWPLHPTRQMSMAEILQRQPGGNGPRELYLSADFLCAGPSVFEPLRARDVAPVAQQTTPNANAKRKGRA